MGDFKTIQLRPMTGVFDTLSSADEVGFGNWRVVKNATTRSTRNRRRAGGWRRLFADKFPYNNQDLHDQLTDRLGFYDEYDGHAMGGGDLAGYHYPYFAPAYTLPGGVTFPPASGPFCPVYFPDFADGKYGGCQIFYPFVGFPYSYASGGSVNLAAIRAHWRFEESVGSAAAVDYISGALLTNYGAEFGEAGVMNNGVKLTIGDFLSNDTGDAAFLVGDIKFGFTGWFRRSTSSASEFIIGRWNVAGGRYFRLYITGGQLRFEVSNDGTATVGVTTPSAIPQDQWIFFAFWHDPVLNTINLKVNADATASAAHATGLLTSSFAVLCIGKDFDTSVSFQGNVDEVSFWKNGFPTETELGILYDGGAGISYPFSLGNACNTGAPFYYLYSRVYTSCGITHPDPAYPGYPYGSRTPFYDPSFNYDYTYCGTQLHHLSGCREAVTMLQEIVSASGRKLIAATMSRVYELNQSSGNWRILADGLGNSGYTTGQCTCNSVRGVSATLGGDLLYTNNFDAPSSYFLGDDSSGCGLAAMQPITDLVALNITRAGGVVTWKGFVIFYDITEDGERKGGTVLWGDFESASSFIESDTSFAGSTTVAVGETILAAAPLGNWLILYTDKSIIRVTLVGGEDVFNFEVIYKGGNALKYKFSLVNAGDQHLYVGESDIFVMTQFDTRPINVAWITRAAGMMFNGISEDDATYSPINRDACNLVTGGWSDEKREAWISWPTGDNVCPNVTLRLNLKFGTADFIDHGFTAFLTFRSDDRPTVGEWMEDLGICPRGSKVAVGIKDGPVCTNAESAVVNPPLYIRNETEDPDLPIAARSLCALLTGKTLSDYCDDCVPVATFITASAVDFCLKQQEDDVYYREMLGGNMAAYDAYSCQGQYYHHDGYDTVMQQGAEGYRNADEKMVKMIGVEAEPLPQSTPSSLVAEVGYAPTPNCFTWQTIRALDFECRSALTASQRAAYGIRSDSTFYFPCWRRGIYLSARFRLSGLGGGGDFSAMQLMIKGWGQQDSP